MLSPILYLNDDERHLLYEHVSLVSMVALAKTCKELCRDISIPGCKTKQLLKDVQDGRLLNKRDFCWKQTGTSIATHERDGTECFAVGYGWNVSISGKLEMKSGYVTPMVSANAFDDKWLPQLETFSKVSPQLLRGMTLTQVSMSRYGGGYKIDDVWYRQIIPLKVVFESCANVRFTAKGGICMHPDAMQDAYKGGKMRFDNFRTHINWDEFAFQMI